MVVCANPKEGLVRKAEDDKWYCVHRLDWVGMEESWAVVCKGNATTCGILAAIAKNHAASAANTNYRSHLTTTLGSAEADDIENVFLLKAKKVKR